MDSKLTVLLEYVTALLEQLTCCAVFRLELFQWNPNLYFAPVIHRTHPFNLEYSSIPFAKNIPELLQHNGCSSILFVKVSNLTITSND